MIHAIEKELMIVGVTAFVFKIVISASDLISGNSLHALEFADTLVPLFSFCNCMLGLCLVFLSIRRDDLCSRAFHMRLDELLDEYFEGKDNWRHRLTPPFLNSLVSQLEFRIFHNVFCEMFNMHTSAVAFDEYMSLVGEKYIHSVIRISPLNWTLFGCLALLDYLRIEGSEHIFGCTEGDLECLHHSGSVIFTVYGTGLFLVTLVFAVVSRYYELQVIRRKGISGLDLYPAYLQYMEESHEWTMRKRLRETDLKKAVSDAKARRNSRLRNHRTFGTSQPSFRIFRSREQQGDVSAVAPEEVIQLVSDLHAHSSDALPHSPHNRSLLSSDTAPDVASHDVHNGRGGGVVVHELSLLHPAHHAHSQDNNKHHHNTNRNPARIHPTTRPEPNTPNKQAKHTNDHYHEHDINTPRIRKLSASELVAIRSVRVSQENSSRIRQQQQSRIEQSESSVHLLRRNSQNDSSSSPTPKSSVRLTHALSALFGSTSQNTARSSTNNTANNSMSSTNNASSNTHSVHPLAVDTVNGVLSRAVTSAVVTLSPKNVDKVRHSSDHFLVPQQDVHDSTEYDIEMDSSGENSVSWGAGGTLLDRRSTGNAHALGISTTGKSPKNDTHDTRSPMQTTTRSVKTDHTSPSSPRSEKKRVHVADLFLFSRPRLFFDSSQVLMMFISLHLALWLIYFLPSEVSAGWKALTLLPGLLSFASYTRVAHSAAFLQAMFQVDNEALLEVVEQTDSSRVLRETIHKKLHRQLVSRGDPQAVVFDLFREVDGDEDGEIGRAEFAIYLNSLDVHFSRKKWQQVFRSMCVFRNKKLSFDEFSLFLFPTHGVVLVSPGAQAPQQAQDEGVSSSKVTSKAGQSVGGGGGGFSDK
eukprot:gene22121-28226_t